MLLKNFQCCSKFTNRKLGRISPRPPESKTGGLVGLEDSTTPYDAKFSHCFFWRASFIVNQAGPIITQTPRGLRNHRCSSLANVTQHRCSNGLNDEMPKKGCILAMLPKNFQSCSKFSKRNLGQISTRPPEMKNGGRVDLEDATKSYDMRFNHCLFRSVSSNVNQAGSMVAQTPRGSRNHRCSNLANVSQQCCATFSNYEISKNACVPPMLVKDFYFCATFSKRKFGRVFSRPPETGTWGWWSSKIRPHPTTRVLVTVCFGGYRRSFSKQVPSLLKLGQCCSTSLRNVFKIRLSIESAVRSQESRCKTESNFVKVDQTLANSRELARSLANFFAMEKRKMSSETL